MFKLEAVCVSFGQTRALSDVSLEIKEAETTSLIGSSGSGKSTILRLILGLIKADSGRVSYRGRALDAWDLQELRKQIGFMTQLGGLFPHLTIQENLFLAPDCFGWNKSETDKRIDELLQLTRLDAGQLGKYPHQISGGQRQRAALIRALMLNPETILLDEPMGALDPITRFDLQNDLKQIFHRLKKTVVLVTHDIQEARFFSETIHVVNHGEIIQSGSYFDLLNQPASEFVKRFFTAQRYAETEQ